MSDNDGLPMLDTPAAPHWDGETGMAVWGNVPEASISGEVGYHFRIYRQDTETPPEPGKDMWLAEDSMSGQGLVDEATNTYSVNMTGYLHENGFYYFEVCAAGDVIQYADSFNVCVYDKNGNYVMNNTWPKEVVVPDPVPEEYCSPWYYRKQ